MIVEAITVPALQAMLAVHAFAAHTEIQTHRAARDTNTDGRNTKPKRVLRHSAQSTQMRTQLRYMCKRIMHSGKTNVRK